MLGGVSPLVRSSAAGVSEDLSVAQAKVDTHEIAIVRTPENKLRTVNFKLCTQLHLSRLRLLLLRLIPVTSSVLLSLQQWQV